MKKVIKGHQGDVQFKSVDKIPSTATKINKKPIALGEHSGHQHVITGDYELFEDKEGNIFAAIGSDGATLQHIHESKFTGFDKKEIIEKADHKPIVEALQPYTKYVF